MTNAFIFVLCPKCGGQGIVSKPPWVPGDVCQWSAAATAFVCDVCDGAKVLMLPTSDQKND